MDIKAASVHQDFLNGVLCGEYVEHSEKLYKDAQNIYKTIDESLDKNTLMYEVYSYSKGDPKQVGNLNWGLTVMKPVYVNGECNITRGHFHEDLQCAEFYFCLHGEGLLLFMDEHDICHAEKMEVGSIHHIDGKYAHRLVNTGDDELRVGACWPTTAGHDYARIEQRPFSVRVYKKDNDITIEEENNQ